ncbi:aminoglycoside phosphotransferase family protein [Fodinicola feengrottensis]|uniref:aminoglycoside phosphotransferase family protein n=1 Tax=Fodinicola feengrottensis TaxID=435914 RepID=UPI0024425050|nr:aminoglycoside phosphotransferase family protein [Fodinicola feengrottensis]
MTPPRRPPPAFGLDVDDAVVVHNSDRIAVRLIPCDVLARVAPSSWQAGMEFEAEVARRLAETDSPIGELESRVEPGVHVRGGFAITLWTYYEPVAADRRAAAAHEQLGMSTALTPADYAHALVRLHGGLRQADLPTAHHITARVAGWAHELGDRELTPELRDPDRALVSDTLSRMSAGVSGFGSGEQLLHGEPHPGNVLSTKKGPLFIDLETCQRGPVEYDLAYVPEDVAEQYPGADQDLVHQFRILMWAGVTTMRWNRDDQYPGRDHWRIEALHQLRAALSSSVRPGGRCLTFRCGR